MDFKLIGSILLIVGTSIGAGMLALPIATAQLGFLGSLVLLFSCWFVMTAGALLILEVNLWLPQNSNLISMARATIGPLGQLLAWVTYLLLLYSLLCAYIAGGSDLLHSLLIASGVKLPKLLAVILFVLFFGFIVVLGIRAVDYTNRGLMFVKFASYLLLVLLLTPFISLDKLTTFNLSAIASPTAIMVTITSFGYAAIVPSLRVYFAGDVHKLKTAIFVGSFIPLLCYVFWDAAIMGVIPLNGSGSLASILQSPDSTSALVNTLDSITAQGRIIFCTKLFTSICVLTSFLAVALCLTDFLADGLQMQKQGLGNVLIHVSTFLPPLLVVVFFPHVFISALAYAGVYCILLLVLLPAWMAWCGRYRKGIATGYRVPGGKLLIIGLAAISAVLLIYAIINEIGF